MIRQRTNTNTALTHVAGQRKLRANSRVWVWGENWTIGGDKTPVGTLRQPDLQNSRRRPTQYTAVCEPTAETGNI